MKTLFIQTHELARYLCSESYTCTQISVLISATSVVGSISGGGSCIMKALYLEQKEDRNWKSSPLNRFVFEDIFIVPEDGGIFSIRERRGFRQRLINSLLTRPDRTLCVLIPE